MTEFAPKRLDDPLARVVLVEPLIPENTGNISRTCVATGSELHLVEPMGFEIDEKRVRRAGLDYWPDLGWQMHASFSAWQAAAQNWLTPAGGPLMRRPQVFYVETEAPRTLYDVEFQRGDWLVFGKETSGLGREILQHAVDESVSGNDAWAPVHISIPMPGTTRSLNLSNAAAITVFELLRQTSRR